MYKITLECRCDKKCGTCTLYCGPNAKLKDVLQVAANNLEADIKREHLTFRIKDRILFGGHWNKSTISSLVADMLPVNGIYIYREKL